MKKYLKYVIIFGIIVIALIVLFASIKTVPTGTVGVKTRFGAVQDTVITEGINLKVPFIEKIVLLNCKIQKIEINTLEEFNPRDVLDVYKSKCNESDYLNSNTEEKILSSIETDKCEKVVSQSYVEKETIKILENKVKIIDFRFASMNSPFFDIAYFSNSFNLNEKQDKFLLTKYFGYKLRTRYFKLIEHYKKYINLLRYYRNCYYYTISGEVVYLDIKNELKNKISNI